MRDATIVQLLQDTGHLEHPFGERQEVDSGVRDSPTPLLEPAVIKAIASYHDFNVLALDRLCLKHHSRSARCDGGIGPATRELFDMPRCGCPDHGESVLPATGTGSWESCHGIGDFHAATTKIDTRLMPSFLKPHFDEVWARVVASYEALGLRFIRTEDNDANIKFSWVIGSKGWIGLAIVGQGESCGSSIWCKYLAKYNPSDTVGEWTTLIMHELGHNASLQHTRGGVMSPYIINGLQPTWKGDPSESSLNRFYGGSPVTPDDPPVPPVPTGFPGHHINRITLPDGRYMDYDSIPRSIS